MNMIKFALLGTAAIAAVSVSAQASTASDIAALKAQVEALSAQVAANEAQTAVPAGFQLVTVSQQPAIDVPGVGSVGRDVTTIAILPTADAPASTVIQWSGFARAALVYADGADTAAVAAVPATPGNVGVAAKPATVHGASGDRECAANTPACERGQLQRSAHRIVWPVKPSPGSI